MELKEYIRPLLHWWWLLVASTLIATLSSFIATRQQPPIYQAKASLIIGRAIENPNPTGNEFWLGQQLAQTYVELAQREPIRVATMQALSLTWLPEYTIRIVPSTLLIELSVNDTDAQRAAIIANELANQLMLRSPTNNDEMEGTTRQQFINNQLNLLEIQIDETQSTIEEKQTDLAVLTSARQIADTQTEIIGLQAKLTSLQANYASLLSNTSQGAINQLSIIESALPPTIPIGPNKTLTIATAAAIGLLLSIGSAYLMEYLDDSVRTVEELATLDLPVLAAVPYLRNQQEAEQIISLSSPRSPVTEAYRAIRTAIQFANVDRPHRTLLITSPNPSDGKSLTAINIATVFAQLGQKVLVIDADLRRPRLSSVLNLPNHTGLTNLLLFFDPNDDPEQKEQLLQQQCLPTSAENLFILTSGTPPPNPAELLNSAKLRHILHTALTRYEIVIFDSPPILAVTDAIILSRIVNDVIVVGKSGHTSRADWRKAIQKLQDVQAHITGTVLTQFVTKERRYYYAYEQGSRKQDAVMDRWQKKPSESSN